MKAIIAIDSFKGSLSSLEAGHAARRGILKVFPNADVTVLPVADGGEGTAAALTEGMGGTVVKAAVTGPLGETLTAEYGIIGGSTAVMEMASAAGLPMVPEELRDPMVTTTYGVGEMIRDAIGRGCRSFIVGIGGSATNDCGIGMLSALGFRFLNADGTPVRRGARDLCEVTSIDISGAMPELSECTFKVACDVKNPLCGPLGCSAVFAPQKGASPESISIMDAALSHFARLTSEVVEGADPDYPGSGAAGGLGFAFRSYLSAELCPGVDIVLDAVGLDEKLSGAELVITGEGKLDSQTVMGKAPAGVAAAAARAGVAVIAVSGIVSEDAAECNAHGIDAFFPILRRVVTAEEAMRCDVAARNLTDTVEQIMRVFAINYKEI